jgi:hypothetical protein
LEYFDMSDMAGLSDLVAEIKEASRNIELGDARTGKRLEVIEPSCSERRSALASAATATTSSPSARAPSSFATRGVI